MKFYIRPQAHHWVILRLIRTCVKAKTPIVTFNVAESIVWLMHELGRAQVFEMIDRLIVEELHHESIDARRRKKTKPVVRHKNRCTTHTKD